MRSSRVVGNLSLPRIPVVQEDDNQRPKPSSDSKTKARDLETSLKELFSTIPKGKASLSKKEALELVDSVSTILTKHYPEAKSTLRGRYDIVMMLDQINKHLVPHGRYLNMKISSIDPKDAESDRVIGISIMTISEEPKVFNFSKIAPNIEVSGLDLDVAVQIIVSVEQLNGVNGGAKEGGNGSMSMDLGFTDRHAFKNAHAFINRSMCAKAAKYLNEEFGISLKAADIEEMVAHNEVGHVIFARIVPDLYFRENAVITLGLKYPEAVKLKVSTHQLYEAFSDYVSLSADKDIFFVTHHLVHSDAGAYGLSRELMVLSINKFLKQNTAFRKKFGHESLDLENSENVDAFLKAIVDDNDAKKNLRRIAIRTYSQPMNSFLSYVVKQEMAKKRKR